MWCRLATPFGKARKPTRRRMLNLQRSSCHYLLLEVFLFSSTYSYTLPFFFFCTLISHLFILFDLSYTNVFASSIERYLNMENYQFARYVMTGKKTVGIGFTIDFKSHALELVLKGAAWSKTIRNSKFGNLVIQLLVSKPHCPCCNWGARKLPPKLLSPVTLYFSYHPYHQKEYPTASITDL